MQAMNHAEIVNQIFWKSLEGSPVNLARLREKMATEQDFRSLGLDSLDLVEFFLRVQEHFAITIRQEDYAELASIDAVVNYVRSGRTGS